MVDLVLDLEIAERTFQAAASCSCPEPQEGFFHDDENFIAEFTFPCENSPCIAGFVTTAEFAHEAPSLSVNADGNGIVVTKAWSSFTTSETILSDMGTLFILKVAILLDFLTYFSVSTLLPVFGDHTGPRHLRHLAKTGQMVRMGKLGRMRFA